MGRYKPGSTKKFVSLESVPENCNRRDRVAKCGRRSQSSSLLPACLVRRDDRLSQAQVVVKTIGEGSVTPESFDKYLNATRHEPRAQCALI